MSVIPAWVGALSSITDRILSLPAWLLMMLAKAHRPMRVHRWAWWWNGTCLLPGVAILRKR